MRSIFVNYHTHSGGASVAARRLADALEEQGVSVSMVSLKGKDDRLLSIPPGLRSRIILSRWLDSMMLSCWSKDRRTDRSYNLLRTGLGSWLNKQEAHVVHLHWVARGLLSWRDIADISLPVVWTFHDGWGIGDGRYYPFYEVESSYEPSGKVSALLRFQGRSFEKRRSDLGSVQVVSPSEWLAFEANRSGCFGQNAVAIANPLSRDWLIAGDGKAAIGERRIWSVGATGLDVDPRKGWRILHEGIERYIQIGGDPSRIEIHLFGNSRGWRAGLPVRTVEHGMLSHENILKLFAESELFICPSLLDNFPNVIAEAQSRGCPVLALPVGGVKEMIAHGVSGYLAMEATSTSLGDALLHWELEGHRVISRDKVAQYARSKYDPTNCAKAYLRVYQKTTSLRS